MRIFNRIFKYLVINTLFLSLFAIPIQAQMANGQSKFLGNIHVQGQTSVNFDYYWNQITPGNAGKWASCEQNRGDFNYWLWLDRAYNHAKQNGFKFKEHCLVWGGSSGDPTWMSSVPANEQQGEVLTWFDSLSARYPDFDMIDVVNEPLHAPPLYKDAIGGDGTTGWDWVIWCFQQARQRWPNATLILNEYNVLNYTSTCQSFLQIVRILQSRGLIDGIGCQAHSLETIPLSTIQTNMDSLAATGLNIYISEYDVQGDDSTQLALYQQQFTYFWENPAVKGITLWGYVSGEMWRQSAYLLETDGITERPALQWLRSYFNYDPQNVTYNLDAGSGVNGSIAISPAGGVYAPFTNVTVTATPDNGYVFSNWTGDVGGSANPATVSMISNRQITAHFVEKGYVPQYTLNVSVSGNGTVTQDPVGTTLDSGTVVTLTAVPDSSNMFVGWSGSSTSTSSTIQITMNGNKVLTALFQAYNAGNCNNPISVALPFVQNGAIDNCYFTTGTINNVNSWNTDSVKINGIDYTNTWSNSMPPRVDGGYYIHYSATVGWAHLEVNGTGGNTGNVPVTGVTVSPATTSVDIGGTAQLNATVSPSDATDKSVSWSSGNTSVATVNSSGLVTGVTAGDATITVTTNNGSYTASCAVTVNPPAIVHVTGVTVNPGTATLNTNETTQLNATVTPSNAADKSVTWSTSDASIAIVDATGLVTAVSDGNAVITVTTTDGGFTASSNITVSPVIVPVTGISVSPAVATVAIGSVTPLTVTISPANATDQAVSWSSGNANVATVNANGEVTALSMGTATITATSDDGGYTASSTVTVVDVAPVTGVTVSPTSDTISVGSTTLITASIIPSYANDQSVYWSSNNNNVATVDQSGLVTGVAAGNVSITATTNDGGFTASSAITVTNNPLPCTNPVAITIPFSYDGKGDFCWVTSQSIAYINSWNMDLVEINGVDFTNVWSNNLPAPINGNYYIHYVGSFDWSHFEAPATKSAQTFTDNIPHNVKVYPVPFTNELNIDLNGLKNVQHIRLYNALGQLVKSIDRVPVSTNLLKMGIYAPGNFFILRITTSSQEIIKTITKK